MTLSSLTGYLDRAEAQGSGVARVEGSESNIPGETSAGGEESGVEIFTGVAEQTGIDFVHFSGMSGNYYYPEMIGPGGALFDYDNDGDLDVFIHQGQMLGPKMTLADALFPPEDPQSLYGRLYRNDLKIGPDGSRVLRFTDVTDESGIDARYYGMGAAVGDYLNDGWADLYLTNYGPNKFYRNNGDGTFSDVTEKTGTDDARFSSCAAFLDYDRDGRLDLFLCNYVNFSFANQKQCLTGSRKDYCGPLTFEPQPNRLFHNRGDGTFDDVTLKSQIARQYNGALGVIAVDFNEDGWLDIQVANDARPDELWINQQDGTFQNGALLAGSALDQHGRARASMGVDAGDFDNDGDEDMIITCLRWEGNTFYENTGAGWFEDRSVPTGLGLPSFEFTGFGTAFFDFDNDGWLDVMTANGEVRAVPELAEANDPYPLHQTNQLFRNLGNGRFEEIAERAGAVFQLSEVSRGAAFGDIDNDGDLDVLVVNNNGRSRLLRNNVGNNNQWLGLRMLDSKGKRDMLATRSPSSGPRARRSGDAPGTMAATFPPTTLACWSASVTPARSPRYAPIGQAAGSKNGTMSLLVNIRRYEKGAGPKSGKVKTHIQNRDFCRFASVQGIVLSRPREFHVDRHL